MGEAIHRWSQKVTMVITKVMVATVVVTTTTMEIAMAIMVEILEATPEEAAKEIITFRDLPDL